MLASWTRHLVIAKTGPAICSELGVYLKSHVYMIISCDMAYRILFRIHMRHLHAGACCCVHLKM